MTSGQRACRAAEMAEKMEWINHIIDQARNRITLQHRAKCDQEGRANTSKKLPSSSPSRHKVLLIGRVTPDQLKLKSWFESWQCQVYTACSMLEVIQHTPFTLCALILVRVDALIESVEEVITLLHNHIQSDQASTTKIIALIPPDADIGSTLREKGANACLPNNINQQDLAELWYSSINPLDWDEIIDVDEITPHILVVEDHLVQQEILKMWCQNQGVSMTLVTTVAEGKAALSNMTFDLLITDIGLPDGSGLELITYARNENNSKNAMTYIVGYTMNVEEFEAKCLSDGANHVACKGEVSESDMVTWLVKAQIHAYQNSESKQQERLP